MGSWLEGVVLDGQRQNTTGGEGGGGRDGVLAFPARGRRTRATKARKSTREK
jgi:hypothetical protein